MNAKAFISHTERGGTDIARIIQDQLKTSNHQMESFLSQHSIEQGERIPEKILTGLSTSDILILIIDPLTIKSKWVEWEYTFCVTRKIPLLVYVDKNYVANVDDINWLDAGIKYNIYDFEKYDALRSEVWQNIAVKKSDLENNSHIRESTQLSITSIFNKTYSEHEKIKISGSTNKSEPEPGKCYFHIPQMSNIEYPMSTTDLKITIQPIEQNFTFEIEIPTLCIVKNEQVCFIEVYFESKSIIIPITITKKDNRVNNRKLSDSQSSNADIFTSEMIDTILQPVSDGTYSSIPKYISDQTIVRTDDIKKITKTLENENRIVITGNKGAGKSVFLCQLYKELINNYSILFLRCDNYLNINSLDELNNNIIVDHNFNDVIQHLSPQSKLLVIFDSLDVISRNVKVMDIFKNFIKTLWGMKNIKTISTVRSIVWSLIYFGILLYVPSLTGCNIVSIISDVKMSAFEDCESDNFLLLTRLSFFVIVIGIIIDFDSKYTSIKHTCSFLTIHNVGISISNVKFCSIGCIVILRSVVDIGYSILLICGI